MTVGVCPGKKLPSKPVHIPSSRPRCAFPSRKTAPHPNSCPKCCCQRHQNFSRRLTLLGKGQPKPPFDLPHATHKGKATARWQAGTRPGNGSRRHRSRWNLDPQCTDIHSANTSPLGGLHVCCSNAKAKMDVRLFFPLPLSSTRQVASWQKRSARLIAKIEQQPQRDRARDSTRPFPRQGT